MGTKLVSQEVLMACLWKLWRNGLKDLMVTLQVLYQSWAEFSIILQMGQQRRNFTMVTFYGQLPSRMR